MPLKAPATTPLTAATISRLGNNTSMAEDTNSQLVTVGQLQEIVNRLTDNNKILKERISGIGAAKVKLPLIKRFLEEKSKLKGFLI